MNEHAAITWVSPQWLHSRQKRQPIRLIDVQPDVHDYILGHIPGAVYMNEKLWRCPGENGLPASYVPTESIVHIVRRIGVRDDEPIVVYGGQGKFSHQGDGLEPTMTAYSLLRFGARRVHILDGGIERWHGEGLAITKAYPAITPSEFRASINREMFCTYDEFIEACDRADTQVLDVRPPSVYAEQGIWSKPGHIAGALNVPWRLFMERENACRLKPREQIQELLDTKKVSPHRQIVVYCGTGREATNAFIVLRYVMGFAKVRLFEGSFTEWCSHDENETVIGLTPY
jgi:thiosulfate/3-mercaptopyruvate sulfurtransferase